MPFSYSICKSGYGLLPANSIWKGALLLDGGNQIITASQQRLLFRLFHSVYSKSSSAHQRIASSRYASAR